VASRRLVRVFQAGLFPDDFHSHSIFLLCMVILSGMGITVRSPARYLTYLDKERLSNVAGWFGSGTSSSSVRAVAGPVEAVQRRV
jgi:hypothetical protein